MARLVNRATEVGDLAVSEASGSSLTNNLVQVFNDYPTISDLEQNAEPEKPLRIKLNLDQLEDFEE